NPIIELEFNPWIDHIKEEESPNELEEKINLIPSSIETSL
ncbi:1869_t:CDS:1, partial [Funneliformis caledonium]